MSETRDQFGPFEVKAIEGDVARFEIRAKGTFYGPRFADLNEARCWAETLNDAYEAGAVSACGENRPTGAPPIAPACRAAQALVEEPSRRPYRVALTISLDGPHERTTVHREEAHADPAKQKEVLGQMIACALMGLDHNVVGGHPLTCLAEALALLHCVGRVEPEEIDDLIAAARTFLDKWRCRLAGMVVEAQRTDG